MITSPKGTTGPLVVLKRQQIEYDLNTDSRQDTLNNLRAPTPSLRALRGVNDGGIRFPQVKTWGYSPWSLRDPKRSFV